MGSADVLNEWSLMLHLPNLKLLITHIGATDKRTDVWSRPLCTYSGIFSPKKTGFSEKKILPKNKKNFFLPFFYATFQCGRYNVFEFFFFFFCPQKVEKTSLKSCS